MRTIIIMCELIFILLSHFDQASTFSQCNAIKNCSKFISNKLFNKKKILNGLKECLLENYTEYEFKLIPPQEANETFAIRYQYFPKELISVNKDTAVIDILMNLFWKDDCLRWNNYEVNPFSYILFSTQEIWKPTVYASSTIASISSKEDTQIIVHSNGECEESLNFRVKIICEDFPFYFPNDYQICQMNFRFKLITNFTLSPFNNLDKNCITKHLTLEEWYIDCDEFVNFENVIYTQEHWPYLSSVNNIYLGNITGKFKLKRFPHYSYSTIVLPSIIVCICSQLITLTMPFDKHAIILSSLFLSLVFILNNLPSFNKFSLLSLIINWIYCVCSSNLIISITCNNIATRKKACMPLLQRYYSNICKFTAKPIPLFVILSITIRLPIIGILLLKTFYGFILGIICMIIIWLVIALYKIFAAKETTSKGNSKLMTNVNDIDDKSELAKLTKAIGWHTSVLHQFLATLYPTFLEASLLGAKSVDENNE